MTQEYLDLVYKVLNLGYRMKDSDPVFATYLFDVLDQRVSITHNWGFFDTVEEDFNT